MRLIFAILGSLYVVILVIINWRIRDAMRTGKMSVKEGDIKLMRLWLAAAPVAIAFYFLASNTS